MWPMGQTRRGRHRGVSPGPHFPDRAGPGTQVGGRDPQTCPAGLRWKFKMFLVLFCGFFFCFFVFPLPSSKKTREISSGPQHCGFAFFPTDCLQRRMLLPPLTPNSRGHISYRNVLHRCTASPSAYCRNSEIFKYLPPSE